MRKVLIPKVTEVMNKVLLFLFFTIGQIAAIWFASRTEDRLDALGKKLFDAQCDVVEAKDRATRAERIADELREQVRALYSVRPKR